MKQTDKTLDLFDISNNNAVDIIKNNAELNRFYVETKYLPKPYYGNIATVKAIVIGPDPSLLLRIKPNYVFGLEDPGSVHFRTQKFNLNIVGIGLDNIYAQNLVQSYCNKISDKNPMWYDIAEVWKPTLKQELDTLFSLKIPVFFTTMRVMQALRYQRYNKTGVKDFYNDGKFVHPSENYLNRTMIPLQPSYFYHKYESFTKNVKKLLYSI